MGIKQGPKILAISNLCAVYMCVVYGVVIRHVFVVGEEKESRKNGGEKAMLFSSSLPSSILLTRNYGGVECVWGSRSCGRILGVVGIYVCVGGRGIKLKNGGNATL